MLYRRANFHIHAFGGLCTYVLVELAANTLYIYINHLLPDPRSYTSKLRFSGIA